MCTSAKEQYAAIIMRAPDMNSQRVRGGEPASHGCTLGLFRKPVYMPHMLHATHTYVYMYVHMYIYVYIYIYIYISILE